MNSVFNFSLFLKQTIIKVEKMKIEKDENSAQVIRTKFGPLKFLKLNNTKLDLDKSSFCVTMSYYT